MRALAMVAALCVLSSPALAASPALTIELVDSEPVGIRVAAPIPPTTSCVGAPVVFEGIVAKGKPLGVAHDALHLCVAQTEAPFTSTSFGPALALQHVAGTAPIRLVVRSRRTLAGSPPSPTLAAQPLVIGVAGDGRIGVRVFANACKGDGSLELYRGVLDPGAPRTLPTEAGCVCIEQTYAPFVTSGWVHAGTFCRPSRCITKKVCTIDPDAPFIVGLPSRAPI